MLLSRWAILERIGSGGFGSIFKAYDTEKSTNVAIKVEKRQGKCHLDKEVAFYETLEKQRRPGTTRAAPRCHFSGAEGGFKIAVFDLMGESLSDLFYRCGRSFSLKTVLMLAQQLISRLESVHEAGIVHRDVKPGNFVMGRGDEAGKVYVIDFGLSNQWLIGGKHIGFNMESPFRGTHRYASVNSHMKFEQSRRDDLEAVAYVLIYFLKGGLPWQSLKVSRSKRRKAIGKYKASMSPETLCSGLPLQFTQFLTYVKMLGFEATPDYQYCRNLFRSAFDEHGFDDDGVWDWDLLPVPSSAPSATSGGPPGLSSSPHTTTGTTSTNNGPTASLNHGTTNHHGNTATFSISQTLAHYMQQQPPLASAAPTGVTSHVMVPNVPHLPPISSATGPTGTTNSRQASGSRLRPSLVQAASQMQESPANTATHRNNGPCVNLGASLSPIPLPLSSRASVAALPKARISIMSNDFPTTFLSVNEETGHTNAPTVHRPHTLVHPSVTSSAMLPAHHMTGRSYATPSLNHEADDHITEALGLSFSHRASTRSATVATQHNVSRYSVNSVMDHEVPYPTQGRRTAQTSENAGWYTTTASGAHLSSPLLGSANDPLASFSTNARLSSSASSGMQRSNSPIEPLTVDFMEEDMIFAHSNASLASMSTSAAISSSSAGALSTSSSSSSSTVASSPVHVATSHHQQNQNYNHTQMSQQAKHHHHHHHHHQQYQVQHLPLSQPASPSSATHPDSPLPISMPMDVAMASDSLMWNSATTADVLAEASFLSNATTTTECHSICTSDTAIAASCGTMIHTLANEGAISASHSPSDSASCSPSNSSPNAKKRRRFVEPHQTELLPEPISKRRSARLLGRELTSK